LLLPQIDYVIHLASPASPKFYNKLPFETIDVNTVGTLNMIKLAHYFNATFLFTSTSEIYGDPLEHPQTEEYRGNVNPLSTRSVYDEAKRLGETIVYNYGLKYKINWKIVRLFNTYGPRMRSDDDRVIPNFINQILNKEPITIYGDGTQTRSFCYVKDTVNGLIKLLESDVINVINIGNPNEITILALIKHLTSNFNYPIIYKDLSESDPIRRKPDISKAKYFLKWEPKVNLDDGLKKTMKYFIEIN